MTRRIVTTSLVLAGLLAAYVAGALFVTGVVPATHLEETLEENGFRVVRAAATPVLPLKQDVRPDVVILVQFSERLESERKALQDYVRSGGEVWILSPDPARTALWEDDAMNVAVLPGYLYASNGSRATLEPVAPGGPTLGAHGLLALDVQGTGFDAVINTTRDTFRDTNGNGVLDAGEPGGPFSVAAAHHFGDGRVVVLATAEPHGVPGPVMTALARESDNVQTVIVSDDTLLGAWARLSQALVTVATIPALSTPAAGVTILVAIASFFATARGDSSPATSSDGVAQALRRARERYDGKPPGAPESSFKATRIENGANSR